MTGKDDPTISCTHLMVKLSVLVGRKIILNGGGNHPPFGRRGLHSNRVAHYLSEWLPRCLKMNLMTVFGIFRQWNKENVEILDTDLAIQHLKLLINLIINQTVTMVTAINNQRWRQNRKRLPKCLEIGTVTVLVVIVCDEISLFWKNNNNNNTLLFDANRFHPRSEYVV